MTPPARGAVGPPELTTVADDLAVLHRGGVVFRHDDLDPDRDYEFHGVAVHTLPRPPGELLARIVTVNDVHFGETVCGAIDDLPQGPIQRVGPGETPYPEVMNRAAVAEIAALDPDVVLAKGDLSADGRDEEWAAFEGHYREAFGDRLHAVRGNHDAYHGQDRYAGDHWIELPGLTVGLLDTVIPTKTSGALRAAQFAEIAERVGGTPGRVLLMGHHQQWIAHSDDAGGRTGSNVRGDDYFGLDPDDSDRLDELCVRHTNVIGYTSGHTHRHRVRRMTRSGVPTVEIGCVKDFPGTWAEYRVHEGGVMQVVHRISAPDALAWSDRCRVLYSDFGVDYEAYALGTLAERCFVFPER
jgi:predicted phosphodiesterase